MLTEGVPRQATSASDAGVHVIGGDVTGPALVAGRGIAFYLWKLLWPTWLSPWYPLEGNVSVGETEFWLATLAVVAISAVCVWLKDRLPGLFPLERHDPDHEPYPAADQQHEHPDGRGEPADLASRVLADFRGDRFRGLPWSSAGTTAAARQRPALQICIFPSPSRLGRVVFASTNMA